MNRTMTALEWALLVVLSVLWGSTFLFLSVATREVPPFSVAAVKVTLAAAALLLAMRRAGGRLPGGWAAWWDFFRMGVFNDAGPFILVAFATPYVPTSMEAVLIATSPLFTVVLAHWLTEDERMTARHAAGVVIGLGGMMVMIGGVDIVLSPAALLGQAACLLASLGYAYASVFGRRFTAMRLHPMATAAGQLGSSAVVLVPLALVLDRPWTLAAPGWGVGGALLALGLLTGALAYSIFFRILATAGATNVVLVTFLSPITAIGLGMALLGERLSLQQVLGMLTIGLGIAVLDGRVFGLLRR